MKKTRFYICERCKNVIGLIEDSGVPVFCCGQKMSELQAGVTDASKEKHVPQAEINGDKVIVNVGETEHPMTEEHKINWVYLLTDCGGQRKILKAGDKPTVSFALCGETPKAVYAYCNLHGLWKKEF